MKTINIDEVIIMISLANCGLFLYLYSNFIIINELEKLITLLLNRIVINFLPLTSFIKERIHLNINISDSFAFEN